MTLYVALCYYDRNQYWDSVPDMEFTPEYTEFARRATEAGVMRGGEALHPVTMATTITVSGGKGGDSKVVEKVCTDLNAKGQNCTPAQIRFELDHFAERAKQQIMQE